MLTPLVRAVLAAFLIHCSISAHAENGSAKPFAEGIISTPNSLSGAFSPDGNTFYFSRYFPELGDLQLIMVSTLKDGKWSEPKRAPFSSNSEGDVAMAPGGSRLFFFSCIARPGKVRDEKSGFSIPDLWYVDISESGYSEAKPVGAAPDGSWTPLTIGMLGASVAADGTLYCFQFFKDGKDTPSRLRKLRLENGRYSKVEDLGDVLNGSQSNGDTYIDPEQRFIIFNSRRKDPNGCLWLSYRSGESWTKPENIGVKIEDAICPLITPDGKSLMFSRWQKGIFIMPLSELNIRQDLFSKEKK